MFQRFTSSDLCQLRPRRICLIKPSALGDVVQTIPLLPAIKRRFPEATISWVINHELRDLVEGHPDLSDVISFHRKGGVSEWISLLRTLRQRRFDLVLDLQGLLRSAVMTAATLAPVRVGLQTAREGSRYSVNCVIPDTDRNVPAHSRNWRIAEALGMGEMPRQVLVATSGEDRVWAVRQIQGLRRPIVAVHPGAKWVTKRWPVDKFAELLERTHRAWSGSVLILGSKAEQSEAEELKSKLTERMGRLGQGQVISLAGQSTLKQLASLFVQVDLAISNDSGPMHLAAGLGTPTLGIFTCTSAIRSGPAGQQHELVSTLVSCAAGYHRICPHQGDAHMACLKELDVERVWKSLNQLVQKNDLIRRVA